jgi:uncharacterized protein (TIGR02996 family)
LRVTLDADVGRLLAEILADPASEAARLVYADHLIERGDPRGELVHVQCKFEKIEWDDPQRRSIDERIADLLAAHETAWTRNVRVLGFDDHLQQVSLRRGFVEKVSIDAKDAAGLVPALRAITPLRELHVTAKDDRHIDEVGRVACELEGLSFRTTDRGAAHAIASRLPRWPHRGRLEMLHVAGSDAAKAIGATPGLRGLKRLRVTGIGAFGMAALAVAPHMETVTTLEIPQSDLATEGLETFAKSAHFSGLRRLQLEHAKIGAVALEQFARSRIAGTLQQLRVHHNKLTERGARVLAEHFGELELLDVEATELRADGAHALLSSKKLPKLLSLDVSRNGLGDDLARAVDAMELPRLRHLACIENWLGAAAVAAFAKSSRFGELRSIDVSGNAIGDAGVIALAETQHLPALDVLRIKSTGVGARGLGVLGKSELGARLRSIDLARNEVDDHGLEALLEGNLAALEALDLAGSALTIRGVKALIASPIAARVKHLTLTGLDVGALDPFLSSDFPELRSLVADRFDDDAARIFASARGLPALHSIVFTAKDLTDAGARALAESPSLQNILWLELDAPNVTDYGRTLLRRRFGHHVAVFSGATLHAFGALGRRV